MMVVFKVFLLITLVTSCYAADAQKPGRLTTTTTSTPLTATKTAVEISQQAPNGSRTCESGNTSWKKIGCYDTSARGSLLVYWRLHIEWHRIGKFAHSFVCACAKAAKASGATHFATHYWGECFAIDKSKSVPKDGGACMLADGGYQSKCTEANISNQYECLGSDDYYVYQTL